MPDTSYERLAFLGSYQLQVERSWAILSATYGDGYMSRVMAGDSRGLLRWRLNYSFISDEPNCLIDAGEELGEITQFQYLTGFVERNIMRPIIIQSPHDELFYLAIFAENSFSLTYITYKLWTSGLSLVQTRLPGFELSSDGQVVAPNPDVI